MTAGFLPNFQTFKPSNFQTPQPLNPSTFQPFNPFIQYLDGFVPRHDGGFILYNNGGIT
jgi:hypothetical protein